MNRLERYLKEQREMSWFRRHRALLILFAVASAWKCWEAYVDAARDRDRGWQVVRSWTGPDATEAQLRPLFEDCHDDALESAFDQGAAEPCGASRTCTSKGSSTAWNSERARPATKRWRTP